MITIVLTTTTYQMHNGQRVGVAGVNTATVGPFKDEPSAKAAMQSLAIKSPDVERYGLPVTTG